MSSSDKQKVQRKLIAQLKVDADFISVDKIKKELIDDEMKNFRQGKRPIKSSSNTPEGKRMRDGLREVIIKNRLLMKRYPELSQLDSETWKTVYREASSRIAG